MMQQLTEVLNGGKKDVADNMKKEDVLFSEN